MSPAGSALCVLGLFAATDLAFASATLGGLLPRAARDRSGAVRGPLAWLFVALIRGYQLAWSPRSGGACRFEPSCSAYALSAVRMYGGVRGGLLAGWRLLRCQPLSRGGYDPVPARPVTARSSRSLACAQVHQPSQSARGAWRR